MKEYIINPENIRDYMESYHHPNFPLVIDDKAGLDFKDEKTRAILNGTGLFEKKSKTRGVKLEITSFRGISLGAMHYYGNLIADGIDFLCLDKANTTTSNWEIQKINPLYRWRYEFELKRPVTQQEIEQDSDRWNHYAPGDFTTSFDTKEEIIALAKQCFRMRFAGAWELWVDDRTVAKNGVYQIDQIGVSGIKVGDYVRNIRSGNFGEVMEDPRTVGAPFIRVMVVKPDKGIKYGVYWTLKNIELIKDAKK